MATIVVTDSGDAGPGTLRAAIGAAGNGDIITFDPGLAGRQILLVSPLQVTKPVTIDASSAPGVGVSGGSSHSDFLVNFTAAGTATIKGLIIANGAGTGSNGNSGTVNGSPTATGSPGGNAAGGIYLQNGSLDLINDSFVNDKASGGSGGMGGTYTGMLGGLEFPINGDGGPGGNAAGAVYVEPGSVVEASGLSFSGDSASGGAGGAKGNFASASGGVAGASGSGFANSNNAIVNSAVCFANGTMIRTSKGDIAVERLNIGDMVLSASGKSRPIHWLGHREIDCRRHPRPHEVMPIRVAAHAFGDNRPTRDLFVSPGHAICVDVLGEVLIPAVALVNGTTIVQKHVDTVIYWHVELEGGHDIILAENLPCESYLEMGNRSFFAEADATSLHASPDARVATHTDFCRPFHQDGPVVAFVRERLAARSPSLGWALEEVPLADLHLLIDGRRIEAKMSDLSARFLVPADAKEVLLVSDTSVPAEIGIASDLRALGVCIGSIVIDDGFGSLSTIKADHPLFGLGFHNIEDGPQRWTAGRSRLPAELWQGCIGSFFLRVELTRPALPRWVKTAAAVGEDLKKLLA